MVTVGRTRPLQEVKPEAGLPDRGLLRGGRGVCFGRWWSGQCVASARRTGMLILAVWSFGSWGSGTPPSVM